jgi:1-acyl-sn-glycerol-3-phosphate acyltransferase
MVDCRQAAMKTLVSFVMTLVRWPLAGAWTVLCITAALLVVATTGNRRGALEMARTRWAPGVLRIGCCRLHCRIEAPLDPHLPWLFASNHQSMVDIPALFAVLPVAPRFLAKRELARVPLLGWYMAAVGMVFVERGRRTSASEGTRELAAVLRRGGSILAFPEGTRSPDGSLQRFKSGALAAAIDSGVPVVPVAIEGSRHVLRRGSALLRSGTIRVAIGTPLPTAGLDRTQRRSLAARVEAAVAALHRSLLAAQPGEPSAAGTRRSQQPSREGPGGKA